MHASVTRRGKFRIAGKAGEDPAIRVRVAVVASSAAEARAVAPALVSRLRGARLEPFSLAAYLRAPAAPAHVVLCAARGPANPGIAFLRGAAARLLWPSPPEDLRDAVAGLLSLPDTPPRRRADRPRNSGEARSALLLEGAVGPERARAALSAAPRDWIVESARHVTMSRAGLAALARAGVRWSALTPVELVAIYASASVARRLDGVRLAPGAPIWIKGPAPR